MTYLHGWSVIPQILVRRERWPGGYKTRSVPLVYPGQDVEPDQPIIRLERKDPDEAIPIVPHLSPHVAMDDLRKENRQAQSEAFVKDQYLGEILPAGLRGRVVDITRRGGVIIESKAALLQGVIGAGNQVVGKLTMWQPQGFVEETENIPEGALLVIPGPLNSAMLRLAVIAGVSGIIASSISSRDLESFLRINLVELIDSIDVESSQANLPQMTLLFTEGPGTMAMPIRTMHLLSHYQGSMALLSGATSLRQGIFPELVISLPTAEIQQGWYPMRPDTTLSLGVQVRVCSGDHEGAIGTIDYLYAHQQVFSSGILARSARLRLEDGSLLTIPLTLIERIS
ncbi:MAG TPA: hypothetical protein VKP04_05700 [Ktedonobacteraceae bacterium]|nr:hypothetical protein [Ktedonobacteraceae bacterium]